MIWVIGCVGWSDKETVERTDRRTIKRTDGRTDERTESIGGGAKHFGPPAPMSTCVPHNSYILEVIV